eukprot:gene11650-4889_t
MPYQPTEEYSTEVYETTTENEEGKLIEVQDDLNFKPIYGTEEEEEEEEEFKGEANMFSTVANITNAAIGAGVLAIPFAFKSAGLIGGILIVIIVTSMTLYSLRMVVASIDKAHLYTYEQTVQKAYGLVLGIIMRILLAFMTMGSQTVYVVVLGDTLPPLIRTVNQHVLQNKIPEFLMDRYVVTAIICFCVILPLACLRSLDALKYPSAMAIFAVGYLVAMVCVYRIFYPAHDVINHPENQMVLFNLHPDIFLSFPIIIFSQNCHILVFPIMKELSNRTKSRMEWSTRFGVSIYGIFYMLIGVVGYLSFHGLTKENILLNFESEKFDAGVTLAQAGIAATAVFSFPLQTFACRNSLNLLFFNGKPFSVIRHYVWAIILVIVTYTVGNLVPKIGVVFSFVGASAGISVMYVIPSLVYLKLVVFEEKTFSFKKLLYSIPPVMMVVGGAILAIICTTNVIIKEVRGLFSV